MNDMNPPDKHAYRLAVQRAFLQNLLEHETTTTAEARRGIPVPSDFNLRALGTIPLALRRMDVIEVAAFLHTPDPLGHKSPVAHWRLTDRNLAKAVLDALPEDAEGGAA